MHIAPMTLPKLTLVLAFSFALFCTQGLRAEMLVAGVDLNRVLGLHPDVQETLKNLIDERDEIRAKLAEEFSKYEELLKEGRQVEEEFRSPAISDSRRRELQAQGTKILQRARQEGERLQEFREKRVQEFGEKYRNESRRILTMIREQINVVSEEKGASLVLNMSGRSRANANILQFIQPQFDITGAVLESFDIDPDAQVPESAIRLEEAQKEDSLPESGAP